MVTVFEQGDIVYMDFDPQAGHEQRGVVQHWSSAMTSSIVSTA